MQYFVVMIDYGRRGREAIVDPEITRREVIARVASGEYKNISFIHEIADAAVDDITAEILAEAALPEIAVTGADLQPVVSIMPGISASMRPGEPKTRRLPAKGPRNTGLTSCPACSAGRKASHLDCYRASCPCPGRRWRRYRLKWTCRFRSGSASWNCPSSATNRGWQNLPPDHRPWTPRHLALRLVHMRRSRRASAPLQVRLT